MAKDPLNDLTQAELLEALFRGGGVGQQFVDEILAKLRPLIVDALTNDPEVAARLSDLVTKNEADRQRYIEANLVPRTKDPTPDPAAPQYRANLQMTYDDPDGVTDRLTSWFRRGGKFSRIQHGVIALAQEGNLSGVGRLMDAVAGGKDGIIPSFYTIIITRWLDMLRKEVDVQLKEWMDRAVAQIGARIDVRRIATDVKQLLKNDPEFRKIAAKSLYTETREEEKQRRSPGFWLRSPFPGVR